MYFYVSGVKVEMYVSSLLFDICIRENRYEDTRNLKTRRDQTYYLSVTGRKDKAYSQKIKYAADFFSKRVGGVGRWRKESLFGGLALGVFLGREKSYVKEMLKKY